MININKVAIGAGYFNFQVPSAEGKTFIASQVSIVEEYFEPFLIREDFDIVIEIGTFKGGLTILLDEIRKQNNLKFKLHTLDIAIWNEFEFAPVLDEFSKREIPFHKVDIFSEKGITLVKSLLESNLKVCVLCDGGSKIEEFKFFSDYLKPGDIIMAHDYFHDIAPYSCPWEWKEISFSDIKPSIESNSLEMYLDTLFPQVAWACYKKP